VHEGDLASGTAEAQERDFRPGAKGFAEEDAVGFGGHLLDLNKKMTDILAFSAICIRHPSEGWDPWTYPEALNFRDRLLGPSLRWDDGSR
jgi:hypothetical protein